MLPALARAAVVAAFLLPALAVLPTAASQGSPTFAIAQVRSLDDDGDGYLDNVTLTFTHAIRGDLLRGPADWRAQLRDDSLPAVTSLVLHADARNLTLRIAEPAYPDTSSVVGVTYLGPSANLQTVAGGMTYNAAATPAFLDLAAPRLMVAQVDLDDLDEADDQDILAMFSEALDEDTITSTSVGLVRGGAPLALEDVWLDDNFLVGFPVSPIVAADLAGLQFVATAAVTDLAGNPMGTGAGTLAVQRIAYVDLSLLPDDEYLILNETAPGNVRDLSFRLTRQPSHDVVLDVRSTSTDAFTVDRAKLTFTPTNWNTVQVVRLTGTNDHVIESTGAIPALQGGDLSIRYNATAVGANVPLEYFLLFEGLGWDVATRDTTKANVTFDRASLAVSESGTSQALGVSLTAKPAPGKAVTVHLAATDLTEGTLNRTRLVFGPGNWSTPQLVKVTGVDDVDLDGARLSNVTVTLNKTVAGRDLNWDAVPALKVPVTTADNDTAGLLVEAATVTLGEPSGTAQVKVKLSSKPDFGSGQVRVKATPSAASLVTVSPANVTFTAADWNTYKTFTLTAVDNTVAAGTVAGTLTLAVETAHTIAAYDVAPARTVGVNVTDDDAGLLTSRSAHTVEEGKEATHTVRLSAPPASTVTVAVAAGPGVTTVPTTLTFGTGNWSTPQQVRVVVSDPVGLQGDRLVNVTHTVTAGPAAYLGKLARVPVTVEENDDAAVTTDAVAGTNLAIAVRVLREGDDNVVRWTLPAQPPAPVAGVQVWRSVGDRFVLAATLTSEDPAFKAGSFTDAGASANARYRVTAFYGLAQAYGYSSDGTSASVASFDTLAAFTPVAKDPGFSAASLGLLGAAGLAVVGALVAAIVALARK